MSERFTVIGLTDSRHPRLGEDAMQEIADHRVFAGGARHREIVDSLLPEGSRWITVAPPLSETMRSLGSVREPVVVFASGDPLFYGFGATLQRYFPEAGYRYFPAFSSLQLLAHRCRRPYQAMRYASLTGRSWQELDRLLIEGEPLIGVLPDRKKTPALIAKRLLDYNYREYSMVVGEALGGPEERVSSLRLEEAAEASFHDLNCVMLHAEAIPVRRYGIPEEEFEGLPGRPDMITKMPVRLATLARLGLVNARNFWDIGFCTGSVSIEARLQFPGLLVTAFEKRPECEGIFERNTRTFRAPGIGKVMGDFLLQDHRSMEPQGVDAVFIGGHGGRQQEIFEVAAELLAPGGRIAVNAVREKTLDEFRRLAASRSFRLLDDLVLKPGSHNPITVAAAEKGGEND